MLLIREGLDIETERITRGESREGRRDRGAFIVNARSGKDSEMMSFLWISLPDALKEGFDWTERLPNI